MELGKKQELELEAKRFFESYKKEIFQAIKGAGQIVNIDFDLISNFSPMLAEKLLEIPAEIIPLLELSLDETGLIKNPLILLANWPNSLTLSLKDIRAKNLDTLVSLTGRIISTNDPSIKIRNIRFECPNCGKIISCLQLTDEIKYPIKCSCGRKSNFNLLSKELEDVKIIELLDTNNKIINIEFGARFFTTYFEEILKMGNKVEICAIVDELIDDSNSTIVRWRLDPVGLKLIGQEDKKLPVEELFKSFETIGKTRKGFAFQEFVAKLFEKKGYGVKRIQKTGDFGIDIIAQKDKENIAIQCKMFKEDTKVSNEVVQNALGASQSPYSSNKVIIVTTAKGFTDSAKKQKENSKIPIELWDKEKVIAEVHAHMNDLEEGWAILNKLDSDPTDSFTYNPFMPKVDISNTDYFDIDRVTTGIPQLKRNKIIVVRDTIAKLESKVGKQIPIEEIEKEIGGKMSKDEITDALNQLAKSGDLFRTKMGYIQKL